MASSYSASLRLNYQAPGDNLNLWGGVLNTQVFQGLEDAVAGRVAFTLSGTKTLTTANGTTDEARKAMLYVTGGSGGTVTIPSVVKMYLVVNDAAGPVIITTGSGTTATIAAGTSNFVSCDATNVRQIRTTDFGSLRITSVGAPTGDNDAATKRYVDDTAFASVSGTFPGQTGNAGNVLFTDGTTPYWGPARNIPTRITADVTAVSRQRLEIDTTGGAVIVTLPATPAENEWVSAWDGGVTTSFNGWATNKVTFLRNGSTINGISDDVECNTKGAALTFEFKNGTWRLHLGA